MLTSFPLQLRTVYKQQPKIGIGVIFNLWDNFEDNKYVDFSRLKNSFNEMECIKVMTNEKISCFLDICLTVQIKKTICSDSPICGIERYN